MGKRKSHTSRFSWLKLLLALAVPVCLVAVIWTGKVLFFARQIDPVLGTLLFVVEVGLLSWTIYMLRSSRYRWRTPSFNLVFFSILGIALVCAFAGIEPLASAKDEAINWAQGFTSGIGERLPSTTKDLSDDEIASPSEYPADITAHLTIAEMVIAKYGADTPKRIHLIPSEDKIWWIVDISVKNLAYENAIAASHQDWKIVANDRIYHAQAYLDAIPASHPMSVPLGKTGETTFRFLVPNTLRLEDAELCYERQEPSSYGSLSGGDRAALYDWDLRAVVNEPYENYIVDEEQKSLRTIANWQGSEGQAIRFEATKSPWVINCTYERASEITTKLTVYVIPESEYGAIREYDLDRIWDLVWLGAFWHADFVRGEQSIVVSEAGSFVIVVDASGVDWRLKIGVE